MFHSTDDPERIYERKKTIVFEIKLHLSKLKSLMKVNFEIINLRNFDQYSLRDLIIKEIIEEKKILLLIVV